MQATAVILSTGLELLAVHRTFLHGALKGRGYIPDGVRDSDCCCPDSCGRRADSCETYVAVDFSSVEEGQEAEFLFRRAEMGHSRKLELYARAFEITGKLSKHILLVKNSAIPKRYFDEVKDDLLDWENKCGAIFTDDTLRAYRALLLALSAPAKAMGKCHGVLRMRSGVSVRGFVAASKRSSLVRIKHCLRWMKNKICHNSVERDVRSAAVCHTGSAEPHEPVRIFVGEAF